MPISLNFSSIRRKSIPKFVNAFNRLPSIIVVSLVFIILLVISYLTRNFRPISGDMGEYLNNPVRILYGELPYRDFWLLFSPGEVYIPAIIYKLFGINIDILRMLSIVISCLIIVPAFYFGKLIGNKNFGSAMFSFMFFFSSIITYYEGPAYIHLYLACSMLSAFCLVKYFLSGRILFSFLGGLFIGCGIYFRIYETGAVFTAFLCAIIVYLVMNKTPIIKILKTVTLFISGSLFITLAIAIGFSDIYMTLFREVVIESVKNGTSMNLPYFSDINYSFLVINRDFDKLGSQFNIIQIFFLFFHVLKLILTFFYYILPFLAIISFLIVIISKPSKLDIPIFLLFFLWGISMFPKGLGRSDLSHISPCITPFLMFIWYIFLKYKSVNNKKYSKILKYISTSVILLLTLIVTVPIESYIQLRRYPPIYLETPHGSIYFSSQAEVDHFSNVLKLIDNYTKEGEYIFVTPWLSPPLYALTGRKDPTYYDSMNDLIVRPSVDKQIKICQDLASHNTRIIVHDPDWSYDDNPELSFKSTCGILQDYIDKNYSLISKEGLYSVYLLKDLKTHQ
jgi:hypothetical protein